MISDYIRGRLKSIGFALTGMKELWSREKNTRIYLFFTVMVLIAAVFFRVNSVEWTVLLFLIGAIWSAEAINSAIERTVDLITEERSPLAKSAKDLAASGVLILAIFSVIIGLIIFLPRIIALFVY